MTCPRRLGLAFCPLAVLLALSVNPATSQDTPAGQTTLRVLLPRQQRVWVMIDGKTVAGKTVTGKTGKTAAITTSKVREIVAPPLAGGKKEYEVTAVWRP